MQIDRHLKRAFFRGGALFLLSLSNCGSPTPDEPSAVINADPKSICAGDNFATSINLDAKQSAPHLTLVATAPDPNEAPLQFTWSFAGAAMQIASGDNHTDSLTIQTAGDRPLEVMLHVVNGEGAASDALLTISVTELDANGKCPLPPTD
jgi:hypothetical protein